MTELERITELLTEAKEIFAKREKKLEKRMEWADKCGTAKQWKGYDVRARRHRHDIERLETCLKNAKKEWEKFEL